jgi:hypothetical protein
MGASFTLPEPAAIATVPQEHLPALLAHLAALQAAVAARLAATPPPPPPPIGEADTLLDVNEAARLARRSISWMRKHGHTLPGFCQPTGKGGRVGWSRRALLTWAQGGSVAC